MAHILGAVAPMFEQKFDQEGHIDDLNNAITAYEDYLKSAPFPIFDRTSCHRELARLYERRFDWGNQIRDLDSAITNYEASRAIRPRLSPWLVWLVWRDRRDKIGNHIGAINHEGTGGLSSGDLLKLASLYERRFAWEDRISDLDNAIKNLKAGIKDLSIHDTQMSNYLSTLARLQEQQFDWDGHLRHIHDAIAMHEIPLKLLSRHDPNKSYHFLEVERLHKRKVEWANYIDDAITKKKASLNLLSNFESERPDQVLELAPLHQQRFDWGDNERSYDVFHLDNAITSQNASLKLLSNSDPEKPIYLFELARLYKRRFHLKSHLIDIGGAIKSQKAAVDLLPAFNQEPNHFLDLARLYMQRFERAGLFHDLSYAVSNQETALKILKHEDPRKVDLLCELAEMRMRLTEAVGGCLWQDLQQIDICIKKQKLGVDITPLMAEMTAIFKETDSSKLYHDIRAFSLRLNNYMDLGAVQDSLEEIAKMDRNLSTAYEDLRARYERIYKSWRLKREQISNIIAHLNLFNSESYTEELHNRIQQADKGFKKMRKALEDQGNALKGYFDAVKGLVASTNSTLPGPTPPDDHTSEISLTSSLPDPSHLLNAIEEGKEKLSAVGTMVGKARYNQTRRVVEEGLSTTTSKLDKLQGHSEKYESKVLALSLYHPQHVKGWNPWREPAYQLPNLVKKMTKKLTEIQRGFDKYKQLIFGLIFRPLSDITEDVKPYLSQVGREVVTKRLHPDMILYEAAFLFLIKSLSRPLGLVEVTEEYKSRLEGMHSGN